jgi:hypothetical protein
MHAKSMKLFQQGNILLQAIRAGPDFSGFPWRGCHRRHQAGGGAVLVYRFRRDDLDGIGRLFSRRTASGAARWPESPLKAWTWSPIFLECSPDQRI